ncbi:hypothetical protein BDP27DRAFT_1329805 [Rhodocollybia butyracea]|uniref:Uncharacterized protein n=1 Tax=Rhodocollybia butyracea TaxID=206335 RepID=A0A9P5PQP7_9AGAR|nr:hypothetical protein BDP27DRAFT_1329805 [Rhodocollybia butyracea]
MSIFHSSTDYNRAGFANIMGWGSKPALSLTEGSPLDISHNPAGAAPDSMRRLTLNPTIVRE